MSTDITSDELTFLNDCFDKMATCFWIVYNRSKFTEETTFIFCQCFNPK